MLAGILHGSQGDEEQDSGCQWQPASLPAALGRSAIIEMFFLLISVGCNNEEERTEILIISPLVEGQGCQV